MKEALESSNGHKNQNDFSSNSDFKHRNPVEIIRIPLKNITTQESTFNWR